MNSSLKFKHMGKNLTNILIKLINNQNLLKLIKSLSNNPLQSEEIVINKISDANIILTPFNSKTLNDLEVKLFLHPIKGNLKNKPLGVDIFAIDICCPFEYWILEGQGEIRPYLIASEIAKTIDGQKEIAGIGEIDFEDYSESKLNESYGVLTIFMKVNSVTTKEV